MEFKVGDIALYNYPTNSWHNYPLRIVKIYDDGLTVDVDTTEWLPPGCVAGTSIPVSLHYLRRLNNCPDYLT